MNIIRRNRMATPPRRQKIHQILRIPLETLHIDILNADISNRSYLQSPKLIFAVEAVAGSRRPRSAKLQQMSVAMREPAFGDGISIIESNAFLRECIARACATAGGAEIRSFVAASECLSTMPRESGATIILSILSSAGAAFDDLPRLRNAYPNNRIVVLTRDADRRRAVLAVGLGADGYVPTTAGFDSVVAAMRSVIAGSTYVPFDSGGDIATRDDQPADGGPGLTSREMALLQRVHEGKTDAAISLELRMSETVVKAHVRRIVRKLDARSAAALSLEA